MREVVCLELDATQAKLVFQACKSHGLPQSGEGLTQLLLSFLDGTLESEAREEPADNRIGASLGEFLTNPHVQELGKELAAKAFKKAFRR
jgi:hypothetical protein